MLRNAGCPLWAEKPNGGRGGVTVIDYEKDMKGNSVIADNVTGTQDFQGLLPDGYRRTREGIERFFITDINNPASGAQGQSSIGVMWDAWGGALTGVTNQWNKDEHEGAIRFNHVPGGANALYMDGHVEFVRYNQGYPCSTTSPFTGEYNQSIERRASMAGGFG
jgi:prepilin-type processing-associated H-X9-DG protein